MCAIAKHRAVHYLWRPFLKDPGDDMVLELAVSANCDFVVTYNRHDSEGMKEQFGICAITPKELLDKVGGLT